LSEDGAVVQELGQAEEAWERYSSYWYFHATWPLQTIPPFLQLNAVK